MSDLKNFTSYLTKKYWKNIEKEIIGCGFSYSISSDIKRDIDKYIDENNLLDFNSDDYKNDTDEYVKYYAYRKIIELLIRQLEVKYSGYPETPKRFKQYYGPRD